MYCPNCGEKNKEDAKFCRKCGTDLRIPESYRQQAGGKTENAPHQAAEPADLPEEETVRKGMQVLKVFVGVGAFAAVVAAVFFIQQGVSENRIENYMEAGYAYMEDGEYEEAVAAFQSAIHIDPREESYEMLESAYNELGDTEMAEATRDEELETIEGVIPDSGDNGSDNGSSDPISAGTVTQQHEEDQQAEEEDRKAEEEAGKAEEEARKAEEEAKKAEEEAKKKAEEEAGKAEEEAKKAEEEAKKAEEEKKAQEVQVVEVDQESVQDLLQLFSIPIATQLSVRREDTEESESEEEDITEFETFEPEQVYAVAALAILREEFGDEAAADEISSDKTDADEAAGNEGEISAAAFFSCIDEKMVPADDLTEEELSDYDGDWYVCVEDEVYEQYIINIFGAEYPLDEFVEYESDDWGVVATRDEDGDFYLKTGEYADSSAEVEIELISAVQGGEDAIEIIAKYSEYEEEELIGVYYMQCRIVPDDDSEFGYVVLGIVPAEEVVEDGEAGEAEEVDAAAEPDEEH